MGNRGTSSYDMQDLLLSRVRSVIVLAAWQEIDCITIHTLLYACNLFVGDNMPYKYVTCVYTYTYIHTYIYICCGVIIWAKFGLLRCYYLGQVCFLQNTVCQKHYKIGAAERFF